MVMDGVLEDALEDQRQLAGRPVRIFLGELEHRILDDVERGVLVSHRIHCMLERAPLHCREKGRDFLTGSQRACPGREWAAGL